jgi:hypothetical protein
MELSEGATRYARPWRPVKPLLMIWVLRARSEAQRAQRRCEVWPVRKESGSLLMLELELVEDAALVSLALLTVLERRRKGKDGTR